MAPKPGELQPNGWLPVNPISGETIPWAEAIAAGGTLSDGQLGYEGGSHFVVPLYFYWSDLQAVIPCILGTNEFTGGKLSRVPPLQHPLFPNLWATRITSIKGLQFQGKTNKKSQNAAGSMVASTKLVLLTVMFSNELGPAVMGDVTLDTIFPPVAGVRQEWQRYCIRTFEPASEVISQEGGSFTFVEGNGAGGQPKANESLFTQTAGLPLYSEVICFRWMRVPQVGLFSFGGTGPALNIESRVGWVNDAQFPPAPSGGYPKGTLLLLPPKFRREPSPLPKDIPYGIPNVPNSMTDYYTVEIYLKRFAPISGIDPATTPGHNGFPWKDLNFYLAKDTLTKTKFLFQYTDFPSIFQLTG